MPLESRLQPVLGVIRGHTENCTRRKGFKKSSDGLIEFKSNPLKVAPPYIGSLDFFKSSCCSLESGHSECSGDWRRG